MVLTNAFRAADQIEGHNICRQLGDSSFSGGFYFFLQNIENPLQLWTVPEQGRFSYNFVVFAKGGIIYRFSLNLTAMKMISLDDLR